MEVWGIRAQAARPRILLLAASPATLTLMLHLPGGGGEGTGCGGVTRLGHQPHSDGDGDEDPQERAGKVAARGLLTVEAGAGGEEPGEATFSLIHFCLTWVIKASSCPFCD